MDSLKTIGKRYRTKEKIGEGGMGVVYLVTDRLKNTDVALKHVTIPTDNLSFTTKAPDTDLKVALANEFRALASLRHPNIIHVLDYGFSGNDPYFTMRYIPNARTITEVGKKYESTKEKTKLLIQALRALDYLHRRGIIHRDMKPENALVDETGHLTLLDFGLAEENPKGARNGTVTGTLAYIAPEVLMGNPASRASDLFAIGIMAYEIFAGEHPFEAEDPEDTAQAILRLLPEFDDLDISRELGEILKKLLDKNPLARYTDADEVIVALATATKISLDEGDSAARHAYIQAAKFVGRETELKQLEKALDDIFQGSGSAWLIGGESGVGKSRLLQEIQVRSMIRGSLTLHGQGTAGGGLPFQLWRDPLRHLALSVEINDVDAGILKEITPDIDTLLERQIAPATPVDDTRTRLTDTITAVFKQITEPTVLLLEDLHWMVESLEVLKKLNSVVKDMPLLILGTYRDDEKSNLPENLNLMTLMTLQRFDSVDIAALSYSMLGAVGHEPQVLELLENDTEGNVFFIVETVRALADSAGRMGNIGRMTLPHSVFAGGVQKVVEHRLNRVPEHFHPLLKLAAVAGRQIDTDLLRHLEPSLVDEWLLVCVNSAVLSGKNDRYQFAHEKLREALINGLTDDEKITYHRQVAETIEAVYPNDTSRAVILAQHWHNAKNTEKETFYSHIAGKNQKFSQPHEALTLLQRALEIAPEDYPNLSELYRLLGDIQRDMVSYELAMEYYDTSLASAQNYTDIAEAYSGLGLMYYKQTELEEARELYTLAFQAAQQAQNEQLVAQVLNQLGAIKIDQSEFTKAQNFLNNSLNLAKKCNDLATLSGTYSNLGTMMYRQGLYDEASSYYEKALDIRQNAGLRQGIAESLNQLGFVANAQGKFVEAETYHERSYAISLEIGDGQGMNNSLTNLGISAMNDNDFETAENQFREALKLSREIGDRTGEADNLNYLGLLIRRKNGDLNQAKTTLTQALQLTREIDDKMRIALSLSNLGDVMIHLGEIDTAVPHLQEALREAQPINAMQPLLRSMMWFGRIFEIQEDYERAVMLWSFVNLHKSSDGETRNDTEKLMKNVTPCLSSEAFANAVTASKAAELDALLDDLLDY